MKKTSIVLRIFISAMLAITSSCVAKQVRETESVSFEKIDTSKLPIKKTGTFEYSEFIYSTSKWPLENFISGIAAGRFDEAIKNLDITYRPSNVDSEMMLNLVRNGFIPVFVKIQNTGLIEAPLNLKDFVLIDSGSSLTPLKKQDLPNRTSHFSAGNVVDNAANLTGIVVFTALIVAVIFAAEPGNYNIGGGGTDNMWFGAGDGKANSDNSLKSTTVITNISYGNALLTDRILKPGETIQGLLFFQTKNLKPPVKPKLELRFE